MYVKGSIYALWGFRLTAYIQGIFFITQTILLPADVNFILLYSNISYDNTGQRCGYFSYLPTTISRDFYKYATEIREERK